MGFSFSLQPVLQQRLAQEEKRQREYGEAQAKVDAAREKRRQVEADIARWTVEIRSGMGEMAFAKREMIERWIGSQEGRLELFDEEIRMLAQQAEQCRQRLVKSVQDRTIMEKLREQERMGWLLEQERAERRFFDELAVREFIDQQHQEKDAESGERIAG